MTDPITEVNQRVFKNLMRLMDGRVRKDICRKAGVPESTLATQLRKKRFTFELLAPLTQALGITIGDLTDPPRLERVPPEQAQRVLREIEETLERAKR